MNMNTRLLPLWAAFLLLALAPQSYGVLMTFSFFQGGYADGASVSGTFRIDDLNGNGYSDMYTELEFFGGSATYSGSSAVPAFSAVVALGPFSFDLDTYDLVFGAESPIPGAFRGINLIHGLGNVEYADSFFLPVLRDQSTAPVIITRLSPTAVTVPDRGSSAWLLLLSAGSLIGLHSWATRGVFALKR